MTVFQGNCETSAASINKDFCRHLLCQTTFCGWKSSQRNSCRSPRSGDIKAVIGVLVRSLSKKVIRPVEISITLSVTAPFNCLTTWMVHGLSFIGDVQIIDVAKPSDD